MIREPEPLRARFRRQLENRLDEIAPLAEAFELWASGVRIPQGTIAAINLMLDELVTNVVMHGYPREQRGSILVDAGLGPGPLEVCVTDHAVAYNPLLAGEPDVRATIEERDVGGLGIHFVRQLADELTYERTLEAGQPANRLRIVKRYEPTEDA